ncbi:MAG: DUF2157 domain-containing protein [Burkholderiaceae bacterium]
MNRHQWLHGELLQWEQDGLINPEQAAQLRQRYSANSSALSDLTDSPDASFASAASDAGPTSAGETNLTSRGRLKSWAGLVIPLIGAVLVGLGVILFFAYNWAAMPKLLKLTVVFGSLIASHGAGLFFSRRGNHVLSEVFHLLGTMLFGAGIWLIAQVYHMDEHYPDGILTWAIGALLMAWALLSPAQAMLAAILFAVWTATEANASGAPTPWAPLIYLLGLAPLAWKMRSAGLIFFSASGFIFSLGWASLLFYLNVNQYFIFTLAVTGIALASFLPRTSFPDSASAVRAAALLPYAVIVLILTFRTEFFYAHIEPRYFWMMAGVSLAAWVVSLASGAFTAEGRNQTLVNSLVLTSLILIMLIHPGLLPQWLIVVAFNLVAGLHAIALIRQGSERQSWQRTMLGFILLGALIAVRFTDLFHSLLARSLAFLLLGIAMIVIGYWYSRRSSNRVDQHA